MNDIAAMEAKKGGLGAGLLIVAALAVLAFSRRAGAQEPGLPAEEPVTGPGAAEPPEDKIYPTQAPGADPHYPLGSPQNPLYAEIPGELIGWGDWYTERDIYNVLGWTLEEYLARREELQTLPKEEWTPADFYATGQQDTLEGAQHLALYHEINAEQGGSFVNGVLTPPSWWTGSVTEWSRYIGDLVDGALGGAENYTITPTPAAPPTYYTPPTTPTTLPVYQQPGTPWLGQALLPGQTLIPGPDGYPIVVGTPYTGY
jgi:hypothetical protein